MNKSHTCTRLGWGGFFWAAGVPEIVGSLRGGGGEAKSMMSSKASGDIDLQMLKRGTNVKLMVYQRIINGNKGVK